MRVSGSSRTGIPETYAVNVRAAVTQIVITCTWSRSGNITVKLKSFTTSYYESNMSIYEKTIVSVHGSTTSILNVKRAALSIVAFTSSETWILYLSLGNVTTYQVSVKNS